jgi:hypothetical protein
MHEAARREERRQTSNFSEAIVDERDVLRKWRDLFRANDVSPETLSRAETLLDGLSGESPLHLRLANELEELKQGSNKSKKKRVTRN